MQITLTHPLKDADEQTTVKTTIHFPQETNITKTPIN